MKKIILTITFLLYAIANGQYWNVQYDYKVKNNISKNLYTFPAGLHLDNSGKILYTVKYGISNQLKQNNQEDGTYILIDKSSYNYRLYSDKAGAYWIGDKIQDKEYIFVDNLSPILYKMNSETKIVDNIKLNKAETEFRGRKYIIWYDASSKIKGGPWKFTNLPGLAYEIYDEENLFHWALQNIEKVNDKIENPFLDKKKTEILPYTDYPRLKYSTKIFVQSPDHPTGIYKNYEQKRDGLEKTFEWEN